MKKFLLFLLAAATSLPAFAQEDDDAKTDVNQYGQTVKIWKVKPEMQDGILVFKNENAGYRLWFDIRVQSDAAVFFGNNSDYDAIGNGMNIRRARFAVKAQLDHNLSLIHI